MPTKPTNFTCSWVYVDSFSVLFYLRFSEIKFDIMRLNGAYFAGNDSESEELKLYRLYLE